MSAPAFAPLMMSVDEFARLHGIGTTTAWECVRGESKNYPPLRTKETLTGRGKRTYVTAEAAAEWRAALPDA